MLVDNEAYSRAAEGQSLSISADKKSRAQAGCGEEHLD